MDDAAVEPGSVSCRAVTAENLTDLLDLFGEQGASGGCWCMFWRIRRAEFERNGNAGNRAAFLGLLERGKVPGILAYDGGSPVGWCSVAPREDFGSLERSSSYRRLDQTPVWSVTCFYVPAAARHRGLAVALLRGAVEHVRAAGGQVVEGYPAPRASEAAYMGTVPIFVEAGFRRAGGDERHPVYRHELTGAEPTG